MALKALLLLIACLPGAVGILAAARAPAAQAAGLLRGGNGANLSTGHGLNVGGDDHEDPQEELGGEQTRTFRIGLSPTEKVALHSAPGRPYVVVTVFSGRRNSEEILLAYLRKLLKAGSIDEILLTVTLRATDTDREWLHGMRGSGEFSMQDIEMFGDVYAYLARSWKPPPGKGDDTIVVKCDDDIVYIDLKHFDGFIRYIATHQDMFIVFANIVNNQVAAYYQQLHGAIPKWSHGIDMEMPYPPGGISGKMFDHPEVAVELHKIFLADPERFSWKDKENDGCVVYRPPDKERQKRFSTNFFGYRYSNGEAVARLVQRKDDEVGLTTNNPNTNCMFTEFVVAHYAFAGQRKVISRTDVLDRYARLRNQSV